MNNILIPRASLIVATIWCFLGITGAKAQVTNESPNVLLVTAHPDDEALFGGAVFRLARELGIPVDLAVITDGAGGYRYSTLAESIYGLKLTDPEVAANYLPAIRKRELLTGGRHVGIRRYHFFDQPDTGRTPDPDSVLQNLWASETVVAKLASIYREHRYDFVFVFIPLTSGHGHHAAAALLALRAGATLEPELRPVVLGAWISSKDSEEPLSFSGRDGYPVFETTSDSSLFRFDRTQAIVGSDRLNYKIPVNWLIAEHKSQGTMQLLLNSGDIEEYWLFRSNPPDAFERASRLFDVINAR